MIISFLSVVWELRKKLKVKHLRILCISIIANHRKFIFKLTSAIHIHFCWGRFVYRLVRGAEIERKKHSGDVKNNFHQNVENMRQSWYFLCVFLEKKSSKLFSFDKTSRRNEKKLRKSIRLTRNSFQCLNISLKILTCWWNKHFLQFLFYFWASTRMKLWDIGDKSTTSASEWSRRVNGEKSKKTS